MKKLVLSALMMALLFVGCKKNNDPDYASLVLGTWVNTEVDGKAVLTDATFTSEYRTDHVQRYAVGYQLDENNRSWIENSNYTYHIDGSRIIIDGSNNLGNVFHMEFDIKYADQQTLTYTVNRFLIDNVEFPDAKTYTNKKINVDYRSQFIGTWYGRCTTPGSTDLKYHYWNYFANGHFDYYYQDDQGNWINKPDNVGGWFLYGDLLATNFENDLISGGTGKAYECWKINIQGTTMNWTGLRAEGVTTSYQMEKVAGPPVK